MHIRILKSTVICTLNMLASVSCLSLGVWQHRKHPINRLQTQFNAAIGLISPIQLPHGVRLLSRPRDGNSNFEGHGNYLRNDWTNYKNNIYEMPFDTRMNVVTPHYANTSPTQNEFIRDKNYYEESDDANSVFENNDISTTEMTANTKQMTETTTASIESTENSVTETYSTTIDIDLTTIEELSRSGVNPSVVASILG